LKSPPLFLETLIRKPLFKFLGQNSLIYHPLGCTANQHVACTVHAPVRDFVIYLHELPTTTLVHQRLERECVYVYVNVYMYVLMPNNRII
jgi:hypothetical protein